MVPLDFWMHLILNILQTQQICQAEDIALRIWNLMQFATTLTEGKLISEEEAQFGLDRYAFDCLCMVCVYLSYRANDKFQYNPCRYGDKFMAEYKHLMSKKLGLKEYNRELINTLLSNMAFDKVDYTNCFRALGNVKTSDNITEEELLKPIKGVLLETSKERRNAWINWMKLYTEQVRT